MNHGKHIGNRNVNLLLRQRVGANLHGGRAEDGANIVGLLDAGLGSQSNVVTVGEDSGARGNVLVAVERVFGLYGDRMRSTSRGGVDGEHRFEFRLRGIVPRVLVDRIGAIGGRSRGCKSKIRIESKIRGMFEPL
jgi:hypothetical protein